MLRYLGCVLNLRFPRRWFWFYWYWTQIEGKILGSESRKKFIWSSMQCEKKKLCMVGHRDLPYHMSGLSSYYVVLLRW